MFLTAYFIMNIPSVQRNYQGKCCMLMAAECYIGSVNKDVLKRKNKTSKAGGGGLGCVV